ncbi:MAG: carboxypeptidase-like regulatory domain-containing protein, partial [Chloroflexi bacterium]|nr:carboxypeptidase-like regulatory domain-containing protein [Chloroflexota bacterium]
MSADESVEPEEPVDPSIVVLEPGENLVGWIGDSRSVALLKRQAPAIESVKGWDAQAQQFVDVESLDPGKGYAITLGSEDSALFRRPMTPALGKIELKRGRNLVTWLGPDDWSIDRVVLGVGRSLLRVDWNGMTYRSSQGENTGSLPLVQRGDALWVEVSRAVNWLQPAGVMPTVKFAGDVDETLRVEVRRDSIDAMSFFSDEFALQPDGSILTVYVAAGVNALVEALEEDGFGTDGVHRLWYTAGGWANSIGYIVLKSEQWSPEFNTNRYDEGDYGYGRYVLAHEYYHAIQQQLSSTNAAQWLVEGGADWAEAGVRRMDAGTSLDQELAGNRNSAGSQDAPPLDHTERSVGTWHYTLGALASHQLELRSGKQSLVEFWRALLPEPLGPLGRWKSNPPWQSVFQDVFGLSVDEFYAEFASWRGKLAPLSIRGRVLGPDGQGLPYVKIVGRSPRLEDDAHDYFETTSERDGSFVMPVSGLGFADVGVDLGGCQIYYTSSGLVSGWHQAEQLSTTERRAQNLTLRIANSICIWQVRGRLTDAQGTGIANQWVYAESDNGGGPSIRTEADGTFSTTVPVAGRYRLSTIIEGCRICYRDDESPGTRQQATQLHVEGSDITGIKFQLTEGLCSTKIAGRVVDPDGAGVPDVRVYARDEDNSTASARTESDGSFSITVL